MFNARLAKGATEIKAVSSARKFISESRALAMLDSIRKEFRVSVAPHEIKAKPCSTCNARGRCCLDAHFVNVRISRLEAVSIGRAIQQMSEPLRSSILQRIDDAIARFGLDETQENKSYACPLYDQDTGCVVHTTGKPLPCIHHACYARHEDMPPDELLDRAEATVDRLNFRVYGKAQTLMPLPIAIKRATPGKTDDLSLICRGQ